MPNPVSLESIKNVVATAVPSANAEILNPAEDGGGDSSLLVAPESILEVCKVLKENSETNFRALQVISGVDYLEYLEVCYILTDFNPETHSQLILKTRLTDRVNPELESVCPVWESANWQERECYDMIGVRFNNHPDHRRILCPQDWQGFPLRKDYVAAKTYNGMEVYPESKMNMEDREFVVRQKQIEEEAKQKSLDKGL